MLLRSFDMEDKDTTNKNITETRKKSDIHAKTEYDFAFLSRANHYLIPLAITQEHENIRFVYDICRLIDFASLIDEELLDELSLLINVAELESLLVDYSFNLTPDNIYTGVGNRVYIKTRDIQTEEREKYEQKFLMQYKSLIAAMLQTKYSYNDYLEGGISLMSKDEFLSQISLANNTEEIKSLLLNKYTCLKQEKKDKFLTVSNNVFRTLKVSVIILIITIVIGAGYSLYHLFYVEPYKDASIRLHEAYMVSDYPAAILSMSNININRMTMTDKYLLAVSFVKVENLTAEQKNNIVSTLSLNDNSLRLDYWIYLGRGEVDMASDIAMQLSDNQLLLYSYMKKREQIETDTSLSGEERQRKLDEIESLIYPLVSQYEQ